MRYSIHINAVKSQEWGLNLNQGALFDLLNQASSWAKNIIVDGEVYFWVSRHMVIDEIPLAYQKPDTVYRAFKELSEKGLIIHIKQGQKDLIRLTEKGKEWNAKNTDLNPNDGNKSEFLDKKQEKNTEINPSFSPKHGNKSEKTPKNTDLNPTDKNTNYKYTNNQDTREKTRTPEKPKIEKFIKPNIDELKNYYLELKHPNPVEEAARFFDYYESNGWKVSKNPMKDWKAAVRNWIRRDNSNNHSQGQAHANHQPNHQNHAPAKSSAELMAERNQADYNAWVERLARQNSESSANANGFGFIYDVEAVVPVENEKARRLESTHRPSVVSGFN